MFFGKKAEQNPSLALPEAFLKMQKLAGVITEAQYNSKKRLIENEVTKEITPEEAAQMVAAKADELKNNPTIIQNIIVAIISISNSLLLII